MARLRCLLFLLALVIASTVTSARDWADVVARVQRSVVRVTHPYVYSDPTGKIHRGTAVCTGFSINEVQAYFHTAYHCLDEGTAKDMKVNGLPARLLLADKDHDLAVLTANLHLPALKPSFRTLRRGEQIATLGHGYGFIDALFRAGYVSHPSIDPYKHGEMGQILIFDSAYVGGMSGGPVFDINGMVVGIVQTTDDVSGFGLNMNTIYHVTSFYWQK